MTDNGVCFINIVAIHQVITINLGRMTGLFRRHSWSQYKSALTHLGAEKPTLRVPHISKVAQRDVIVAYEFDFLFLIFANRTS